MTSALAFMWTLLVTVAFFMTSCATPKTVTVVEYRDRTWHDTLTRVDSVRVVHYERVHGDTIRMTDTICQYRVIRDTRDVYVHDSVPYAVEVVREVRKRNWYDRATAAGFWLFMTLLAMFVLEQILARKYLRK